MRWRETAAELLVARWGIAGSVGPDLDRESYQMLANTIVAMFDAGARDAEVAAFLQTEEIARAGAPWLDEHARLMLAAEIHRAAAGPGNDQRVSV